MTSDILSAFLWCAGLSIAWAPLVYLIAKPLGARLAGASPLWRAALFIAIAPTLMAPVLASAGLSLRAAPSTPPLAPAPVAQMEISIAPVTPGVEAALDPTFTLEKAGAALGVIYLYGLIMAFVVVAVRSASAQVLFARARRADDASLRADIAVWARRIGVARPPQAYFSKDVSSVCLAGIFRPRIILPTRIGDALSREEIAVMCAHEIAHIRRGDVFLFVLTAAVRIVFWFNPFIARLTRRVEQCAEEEADALVVAVGADRMVYANCFVEALKFAATRNAPRLALAPSFTPIDREGRRKRLSRILGSDRECAAPVTTKIAATFVAGLAILAAAAQAALTVAPSPSSPSLTVAPLKGGVTAAFGYVGADKPFHHGVDIKAPRWTKIVAPGDGVVVEATDLYKDQPAWGKVVVIDHGDGLVTRYAHLGAYFVKEGQTLAAGEAFAKVGSTGRSTGPHLHFEVIQDGAYLDPLRVVAGFEPPAAPEKAPLTAPEPTPPLAPTQPTPGIKDPAPSADPKPAARPSPTAKLEFRSPDMAFELAGGEPTPPEPPAAPDFKCCDGEEAGKSFFGYHVDEDGDVISYHSGQKNWREQREKIRRKLSKSRLKSVDGEKFSFSWSADGGVLSQLGLELGSELSKELREARKEIERAAREAQREARHEVKRAMREAAREAEQARREAQREVEQARREAARDAEEARREARVEAERARRQADIAQREARREARQAAEEIRREVERDAKKLARRIHDQMKEQRAHIAAQKNAIDHAIANLQHERRRGTPGVEDAIRSLEKSKQSLERAERSLERAERSTSR